ncbi:N-acetylmuramoyl-L-alanine amidase [Tenacibaculum phage pT24]|uniref:N-acetylmuramoyl-L-alanine amidase n=1 Tax=Tenacibaculum phage pT24 TaxID=1880590 RepID=A0A1B4XWW6_9CAUD|nr:endolysin [Tenacibaculum phage pT24]BAV39312.1 N-acetylmuramoyl-L-alanine amidase [Tenacibaculum phage pT24]
MKTNTYKIIIDCGHGGIKNNVYTTYPNKMHKFQNGEIAYEGVINRNIGKVLNEKLELNDFKTIFIVEPSDPTDLPLTERVKKANKIKNSLYISIHCNAFNTKARGFEVWTSKGETKSDKLAELVYKQVEKHMDLRMRKDTTDGDHDKESQFYVLKNTNMPAILLECLFFDNWDDYQLSKDECFIDKLCDCFVSGIIEFINTQK